MNTMLYENGLTFKDFEEKTFKMICKFGQEYTREFLERYDTYLMETRDNHALYALSRATVAMRCFAPLTGAYMHDK